MTSRLLLATNAFVLCAFTLMPARVQAQPPQYTAAVLSPLPGDNYTLCYGINASGQVAGYSYNSTGGMHAVVWKGTTPTALGSLSGFGGVAYAINSSGQTAGYCTVGYGGPFDAVVWSGTTPTNLGTLGGSSSQANGVNDAGQVVGFSYLAGNSIQHAVSWSGTTATDLGTLGYGDSGAYGINASGQVAGYSQTSLSGPYGGNSHAVVWNGTTPTDLGTLGGSTSAVSYGMAINVSGQVAGNSSFYNNGWFGPHAVVWNGTTPTDLGTLGGPTSYAYGINDRGDVVGMADTSNDARSGYAPAAFLYTGGTMYNLNNLLVPGSGVGGLIFYNYGNMINN